VIGTDALFNSPTQQLAKLAVDRSLPSIHALRQFVAAGGLASYGCGLIDAYRQLGVYCGGILKGEKPSDLPVQQTTKFEFVINLRSAKALGLTVPLPLIGRADEVIE
jgi:putative tryptophan/tyrosine transport system substrate-binding protein